VSSHQRNSDQSQSLGPVDPILAMAGTSGFQISSCGPPTTSSSGHMSRIPADVIPFQRAIYGAHLQAGSNFGTMKMSPSNEAECAAAEATPESDVFDADFPAYDGVDGMMKISF
jgi:hypothetical protein